MFDIGLMFLVLVIVVSLMICVYLYKEDNIEYLEMEEF